MSIEKVEMFTVICDNCKESADEGTDYSCWNDENGAKEVATEAVFLAPYLPFSVKIAYDYFGDTQEIATLIGIEDRNGETRLQINSGGSVLLKYCKLVLKPIYDLSILVTEEFEKYDGKRNGKANEEIINLFCEENGVDEIIENIELKLLPYECVEFMFKHHYDFFGLIEKGLAVSVHDVEQHCL